MIVHYSREKLVREDASSARLDTHTRLLVEQAVIDDRDILLLPLRREPHLLDVLDIINDWWSQWRDNYWTLQGDPKSHNLRQFVEHLLQDRSVLSVAIGLACLAMSLTIFRSDLDNHDLLLSETPEKICQGILASVDQLVLSRNSFAQHLDFVLLTLLRAKIFAESNQVRKAWLFIRKTIKAAQALGVGQSARAISRSLDVQAERQFIGGLLEEERFMGVVFGFPFTEDPSFSDHLALQILDADIADPILKMSALRRVTAVAAENIIRRDSASTQCEGDLTLSIEATLDQAHASLPPTWWIPEQASQELSPNLSCMRLMAQMWYWQIRTFLYLPDLVLNDQDDGVERLRYAQTRRQLCIDAARKCIQCFIMLRANPSISKYVCNCDDFQGILSGCLLVIGTVSGISNKSRSCADHPEEVKAVLEGDPELIEVLKDVLQFRACQQGGIIAQHGLAILDRLTGYFAPSDGEIPLGQRRVESVFSPIVLPYFGTIHVQPALSSNPPGSVATPSDILRPDSYIEQSSVGFPINQINEAGIADPWPGYNGEVNFDNFNWTTDASFMFDTELTQDWNPHWESN